MHPNPSDEIDLTSTDERTIVDLAGRGLAPLMALGRYKYLHAHEPLDEQRHRTLLVVTQPIKGRFTFTIDGAAVDVSPGEAVRIPPGATYRTGMTSEPRGELMWLILRHVNGPADDLHRAITLLSNPDGRTACHPGTDPRQSADRLFTLASRPRDWIADGLFRLALIENLLTLARAFQQDRPDAPGQRHPGVARALARIEEHIAGPCDIADLEAVSGLSSSRFYEAFRAETGTSPKDYLMRRRIEHARRWLRSNPDTTVTEVAHALGFSSSQHFATVFRRYLGCSPSQARRLPETQSRVGQ